VFFRVFVPLNEIIPEKTPKNTPLPRNCAFFF